MSTTYLEGIISIRAAIEGKSRDIEKIYVDYAKYKKRDRRTVGFLSYAKSEGIPCELCEREKIESLLAESCGEDAGKTHGGVIASVGARRYMTSNQLLDKCEKERGYCVYLDGVEDPFNLGYSYRSLYASGCCGLILPERYRDGAAAVAARSSAGASELMDTALLLSPDEEGARLDFISEIKRRGIALCCAALSSSSVSLFSFSGSFPMILFVGGEKRGISPEFMQNADHVLHIPYASPSIRYSLPTATVCAVAGFHLFNLM